MAKEAASCGTSDFGLFPHIKPQTDFVCAVLLPRIHTQCLDSLLIAQEILSAGGQLQARCTDRMVE